MRCRSCGKSSAAPLPVRNWTAVLAARAVAEVAAEIATAGGTVCEAGRQLFLDSARTFPDLSPQTVLWLDAYFEECTAGGSAEILAGVAARLTPEFRQGTLRLAIKIARVDGPITLDEWNVLRRLAVRLGFQADQVFGSSYAPDSVQSADDTTAWWVVLEVAETATMEVIEAAYREQAKQHHPDTWNTAPVQQREAAETRMKAINAAFEKARTVRGADGAGRTVRSSTASDTSQSARNAAEMAAKESAARRAEREAAGDSGCDTESRSTFWR